jgi:hypothetical protein
VSVVDVPVRDMGLERFPVISPSAHRVLLETGADTSVEDEVVVGAECLRHA